MLKILWTWVFLIFHLDNASGQVNLAEVHQAAALAQFTGHYSFLGSFIAIRELYFLVSLVCVLLASSVVMTFFQIPSYFLPAYHNQKRSLEDATPIHILNALQKEY